MSNIGTVIGWKHDHQTGMSTSDGKITEFPGGIPSQAEQDTWTAEYEAYVAANEYKSLRKAKYDALNQFELISDDSINGTTTHKDAIVAIKAAHPKP
jgi:hypothetical protein